MTGEKDGKKVPGHPHGGGPRRRKGNAHGVRKSCTMGAFRKPYTRKADAVSTRKYILHKAPGYRLTDRERRILAAAWNGYVRRSLRISLRPFARMHALAAETWRREIRDLEDWINSMHRESINGETAYDYDSCLAKKDWGLLADPLPLQVTPCPRLGAGGSRRSCGTEACRTAGRKTICRVPV